MLLCALRSWCRHAPAWPKDEKALNEVWWLVGRFFYSFAKMESDLNGLFEKLFSLNTTFYVLLVPQLGLKHRLQLIELALKRQGVVVKGLTRRIDDLAEIRNIIAHSSFSDDGAGNRGVLFDYLGRNAKAAFSERVQEIVGGEPEGSFISSDSFDDLDSRMRHLSSSFRELTGACNPLSEEDFDDETVQRIKDVLTQNVIRLGNADKSA